MPEYVILIFRTIVIYFAVLIIMRLMGKRELGELSPFDFVVAVIIAEMASLPMEDFNKPLYHGLIPVLVLGFLEFMLAWLSLKNKLIRRIAYGRPQIIIKKGKILEREMVKARYNLDDLQAQLREAGYANISDVEYGILEISGSFTVIPKSDKRPLCAADLGKELPYEGLPVNLVLDGKIEKDNLSVAGVDEEWLLNKLQEHNLRPEEVLLASLDDQKLLLYLRTVGKH